MSRQKLTLRLNADVIKKAKQAGMNLSYFLEIKLVEYLALLDGTPRGRFELPRDKVSRALQARAVPGWATSAKNIGEIPFLLKTFSRWMDTFPCSSTLVQEYHISHGLSG